MVVDKLIALVRGMATERPDNVYLPGANRGEPDFSCSYDDGECSDGTVGCIFGQALDQMGFDLSDVSEGVRVSEAMRQLGITFKSCHELWCDRVQENQDKGTNWGLAVADADEEMKIFEQEA